MMNQFHRGLFIGGILVAMMMIGFVAGRIFAASWTEPKCSPPGCNADAPINVSTSTQEKVGGITIDGGVNIGTGIGNPPQAGVLITTGGIIAGGSLAASGTGGYFYNKLDIEPTPSNINPAQACLNGSCISSWPRAILAASNATFGAVDVPALTPTVVFQRTVTMPSTGCPCAVMVSYVINGQPYNGDSSNSSRSESWMTDGINGSFAFTSIPGLADGVGAGATSLNGNGFVSPTYSYSNGQAVTFKLMVESKHHHTWGQSSSLTGTPSQLSLVVVSTYPTGSLTVTPRTLGIHVGQTGQLTATYDPGDGTGPHDVTNSASWASTNTSKATVTNGLVTGKDAGGADIYAAYQGVSNYATVLVRD